MELQEASGLTSNRTCGGCSACCKTHAVAELGKFPGKWCQHFQAGRGCSIYPDRPAECRRYSCVWLEGFGSDDQRPDRLKVVIDSVEVEFDGEKILVFTLWEVVEGAINRPQVQQILFNLVAGGRIVAYRRLGGQPMYVFPDALHLSSEDKARFMAAAEGGKEFVIFSSSRSAEP